MVSAVGDGNGDGNGDRRGRGVMPSRVLTGLARALTVLARARLPLTRRAPRGKKARAKREPDPPLARLFYRYTPPLAVIL